MVFEIYFCPNGTLDPPSPLNDKSHEQIPCFFTTSLTENIFEIKHKMSSTNLWNKIKIILSNESRKSAGWTIDLRLFSCILTTITRMPYAPNCQLGILSSLSNEKDAWLFASFVHGFHKPEGNDIDLEAVGQEFCL